MPVPALLADSTTPPAALAAIRTLLQAAPPVGDTGGGPNMWIILLVPLAIFWFVAIWPERKERKRKAQMLADLKKNARVLTTGGMYATVAAVSDVDLTLKFDEGPTRVRVLKSAIATVVDADVEETGKTSG